jgi:hypothetical protein
MSEYDDEQLGQIMREGLTARADRIDGRLGALTPPRSSRRGRWLTVAAAAVLATGGTLTWQALSGGDGSPGPFAADGPVPADWRAESYGGVEVFVPPTWIEGFGPMAAPDGTGEALWCMDGSQGDYVGRPVFGSDVCEGFNPTETRGEPVADSVWFGAPLPEGTVELGGNYTRVTREVAGVTVTVQTEDPALGQQILATAEAVDVDANGCRTHLDGPPSAQASTGAAILPVCLYDVAPDLDATLIWSGVVSDAAAYTQAVDAARGGDELAACKRSPEGQWVSVGPDVIDFSCQKILSAGGDAHLTRATAEPWASDGTRAYVGGPISGDWSGLFRGMLG